MKNKRITIKYYVKINNELHFKGWQVFHPDKERECVSWLMSGNLLKIGKEEFFPGSTKTRFNNTWKACKAGFLNRKKVQP